MKLGALTLQDYQKIIDYSKSNKGMGAYPELTEYNDLDDLAEDILMEFSESENFRKIFSYTDKELISITIGLEAETVFEAVKTKLKNVLFELVKQISSGGTQQVLQSSLNSQQFIDDAIQQATAEGTIVTKSETDAAAARRMNITLPQLLTLRGLKEKDRLTLTKEMNTKDKAGKNAKTKVIKFVVFNEKFDKGFVSLEYPKLKGWLPMSMNASEFFRKTNTKVRQLTAAEAKAQQTLEVAQQQVIDAELDVEAALQGGFGVDENNPYSLDGYVGTDELSSDSGVDYISGGENEFYSVEEGSTYIIGEIGVVNGDPKAREISVTEKLSGAEFTIAFLSGKYHHTWDDNADNVDSPSDLIEYLETKLVDFKTSILSNITAGHYNSDILENQDEIIGAHFVSVETGETYLINNVDNQLDEEGEIEVTIVAKSNPIELISVFFIAGIFNHAYDENGDNIDLAEDLIEYLENYLLNYDDINSVGVGGYNVDFDEMEREANLNIEASEEDYNQMVAFLNTDGDSLQQANVAETAEQQEINNQEFIEQSIAEAEASGDIVDVTTEIDTKAAKRMNISVVQLNTLRQINEKALVPLKTPMSTKDRAGKNAKAKNLKFVSFNESFGKGMVFLEYPHLKGWLVMSMGVSEFFRKVNVRLKKTPLL